MNLEMLEKSNWIIYKWLTGSYAYGTAIEGKSDKDYRGIFVLPLSERVTLKSSIPEVGQEKPVDVKYYEVEKFLQLALDCNPNIVEFLFPPSDCIEICTPIMQMIIDNRNLFISKKAFHTFSGYAYAQIKKAKGEHKWINNPKPENPPIRDEFCWVIPSESMSYDVKNIPARPVSINKSGINLEEYHAAGLEHVSNTFRLYHYGNSSKGVFRNNNLVCESIPIEDEASKFWGFLIYNDDEYQKAMLDWKNYWTWKKERNPNRWIAQEKGEIDFDCYLEKETEFLTKNGWKKFDHITELDLLATLNRKHNLVFQKFKNRFVKEYTGAIYTYENRFTRFAVTPNHRLYVSDCHRSLKNHFSTKYLPAYSNWHFETFQHLIDSNRSHKHILLSPYVANKKKYPISDNDIILMGSFLSEGSVVFDKKHNPKELYVAQNRGGKLCVFMNKIKPVKKFNIAITSHKRDHRVELTYRIKNPLIATTYLKDFGHGCNNKHLADYVFSFSPKQVELFLNTLLAGDGHRHKKGHVVYYSTSKQLIEDLQRLLFINGKISQIYGSYFYKDKMYQKLPIYQLFIPKTNRHVCGMVKYFSHSKANIKNNKLCLGVRKKHVRNQKIVCFEVDNSILITRNKGKIAIQGNSKNMQHCIRLIISGKNILTKGYPIVRFEGEQLQFLKDIRAGKYEYEYLMEYVKKEMKAMEELYETSTLPYSADRDKIDKLYKEIVFEREYNYDNYF